MDAHQRAERRSRIYHGAIAARLVTEPALLERARSRVESWRLSGAVHPRYIAVWAGLLASAPQDIGAALVADSEEMNAARQSSPFAGALSPRERWRLWQSVER